MRARFSVSVAAAATVMSFSAGLSAHHGSAAYDTSELKTIVGEVTQFHFINPHVLIYVAVTEDDGSIVEWSGELTNPTRLSRGQDAQVPWNKDILQPGDEITLVGNPARNGAPSLRLRRVVDAKGTVLLDNEN